MGNLGHFYEKRVDTAAISCIPPVEAKQALVEIPQYPELVILECGSERSEVDNELD